MANKTFGYMRISTNKDSQKFDRQEAQLGDCDYIYRDRVSGAKRDRPELNKLLAHLSEGDTVLILSIDRLSRSTKDLLDIVETITEKGATLKSIQDSWLDTSSDNPMSDFLLTIMGGLAEMERKMIVKRVQEGVDLAKEKGVKLGRPENKTNKEKAFEMMDDGMNQTEIAEALGISRRTVYNYMKKREEQASA